MQRLAKIGTFVERLTGLVHWRALITLMIVGAAAGGAPLVAAQVIRVEQRVAVDGAQLYLRVRGDDRRAPVLIWLHGGPGAPERPLFEHFNSDLEKHFVVAYWDQRGAGRSFDEKADLKQLTIDRHLADLNAVVDHLRHLLGQERVFLIGHSWGGALGFLYAQRHPDKVAALVAVSPLINTVAAQQLELQFVTAEAVRRNDIKAITRLREIGLPPYRTADLVLEVGNLNDRYGGVYHIPPNRVTVMLAGLFGGLVTPWELPGFFRANRLSLQAMNDELLALDVARAVPKLDVPVYFLLGRYDRHVDASIAAAYFHALGAPAKQLFWFENSGHNVPFEEPDRFNAVVSELLLRKEQVAMPDVPH